MISVWTQAQASYVAGFPYPSRTVLVSYSRYVHMNKASSNDPSTRRTGVLLAIPVHTAQKSHYLDSAAR